MANVGNFTVSKFAAGSTVPIASYSVASSSPFILTLAIDSSDDLYVSNYNANTVKEFAPGSTTVLLTFPYDLSEPDALAVDTRGNLYVANQGSGVTEFAPGTNTPSVTYSTNANGPAPWLLTPTAIFTWRMNSIRP